MRIESKQRIINTLMISLFSHTFSVTKQSQKIMIHKPKITNPKVIKYTCLNKNNYNKYSSTISCLVVWWLWIHWETVGVLIRGWRKSWARNVHRMMLHLHRLCTGFWAWLGLLWWEERRVSDWVRLGFGCGGQRRGVWVSENGRGERLEMWNDMRW